MNAFYNQETPMINQDINSKGKKRELYIWKYINECKNKKVLYIHIPFCVRKCSYCVCQSNIAISKDQITEFIVMVVKKQIAQYKQIFEEISFDQVYIGGGTPTLLSIQDLVYIFNNIPNFSSIPLKCIEGSPETLSLDHLVLFQQYGFNFLSIGIQSLSKSLCKKHNRYFISHDKIKEISDAIRNTSIYINFDLICFLGKGDIRDIPQFKEDLFFLMNHCYPDFITIHQLQQVMFTTEKTNELIKAIRELIHFNSEYSCVNSLLCDNDLYLDTIYQAEYRLAYKNKQFTHYMWNKFASMPVKGYDILSIGYTNSIHTISNVDKLFYSPGEDKLKFIEYDSNLYDNYHKIRNILNLD